jgi:hypothetical protein
MASDNWNGSTTILSDDDGKVVPNQRARIPTVPYGITISNNENYTDICNKIVSVGDYRELMIDYSNGDAYIKNGEDVYNLGDKIAQKVVTDYGDNIYVNIDGATVNLSNTVAELSRNQIYSTPVVFMDSSNWVTNGKEIQISPDNKTTELVYDTSDKLYKLQLKGFNPEAPLTLTNKVPYIGNTGTLEWKDPTEFKLPGFEQAEENTVPVKSEDSIKWSKVTADGNDVNFVDIDTLETAVNIEVSEAIVDNNVIYGDPIKGYNVVCVGATLLDLQTVLETIDSLSNELAKEKISHTNDIFTLSSRISAMSSGHSNVLIDTFSNGTTELIDTTANSEVSYSINDNTELIIEHSDSYLSYDLTTIPIEIDATSGDVLSVNIVTDSDISDLEYAVANILLHNTDTDKWETSEDRSTNLNSDHPINIPLSNNYDKFKVYISYSTTSDDVVIKNLSLSYTLI